ncbi:MAG: CHRD domain-containing protein [FCB group bacterium]|jgi:hypothetical protein|nr:CHRD domain-containing protein [FCB group bacterium]
MLRILLVFALVGAIALPAGATLIRYETPLGLTGSQEFPPNASTASGTAVAYYDTETLLFEVNLTWSDLLAPVTAAHIHLGNGPGTNGGIAVNFTFLGIPNATSGTFSHVFDLTQETSFLPQFLVNAGGTVDAARETLLARLNAGDGYFNIHNSSFPGGEIRGDIHAVVPEPASLALVGIGAALALLRRRLA